MILGFTKFLKWFQETGNIHDVKGQGRPTKVTQDVWEIVEAQMQKETMATQLHTLLKARGNTCSCSFEY